MQLNGNMATDDNMLTIGGIRADKLIAAYGSPLYVIDQADFEDRAQAFKQHFVSENFKTHVIYASKAFSNVYISELAKAADLHIDVVSGGELYTVLKAGYDPSHVYFHGNNKTPHELAYALDQGIGTIIFDNDYEYQLISDLAKERKMVARVLLRVNPGIEADTHKYIQTTKEDSKFGMSTTDPRTMAFIQAMAQDPAIDFAGVHCHIGSQVMKAGFFYEEAQAMIAFAKQVESQCQIDLQEVNLGGGFGVYYTDKDQPLNLAEFLPAYIKEIEQAMAANDFSCDIISIEPGRSMINDSGSTLYTLGAIKHPQMGLPFAFIDGGMSDNLRPALYQAEYEAAIANRINEPADQAFRVAGKCCETGDILIQEVKLANPQPGDILVVPRTGAYTFAMASNYNRIEKPAVVFVKDGQSKVAVKRETYADMTRNDCSIKD